MALVKKFAVDLITGTFTGIAPAGQANGRAVFMGSDGKKKVTDLSAIVTVDGETDTITLAAKWQVSNDSSTWFNVANNTANGAATVLVTGTAGGDAAVTKVIPAPTSSVLEGYRFARCSLVVGVVTGTDSDTYQISYSYNLNT